MEYVQSPPSSSMPVPKSVSGPVADRFYPAPISPVSTAQHTHSPSHKPKNVSSPCSS